MQRSSPASFFGFSIRTQRRVTQISRANDVNIKYQTKPRNRTTTGLKTDKETITEAITSPLETGDGGSCDLLEGGCWLYDLVPIA